MVHGVPEPGLPPDLPPADGIGKADQVILPDTTSATKSSATRENVAKARNLPKGSDKFAAAVEASGLTDISKDLAEHKEKF